MCVKITNTTLVSVYLKGKKITSERKSVPTFYVLFTYLSVWFYNLNISVTFG